MDVANFISDSVNIVDFYITPQRVSEDTPWVQIGFSGLSRPLPPTLGKGSSQTLREYHHRDLCYVYDTGNDGQRVLKQQLVHHGRDRNCVVYAWNEQCLPSHKFPCVNEITHRQTLHRTSYRVNNRVSFIVDHDGEFTYYYVRYQHAPNVDTKKMEQDIQRTLAMCKRAIVN